MSQELQQLQAQNLQLKGEVYDLNQALRQHAAIVNTIGAITGQQTPDGIINAIKEKFAQEGEQPEDLMEQ